MPRLIHLTEQILCIIYLLMAAFFTLNIAIISLRCKDMLLLKSGFLELVVDICCQNKMLFLFYDFIKLAV